MRLRVAAARQTLDRLQRQISERRLRWNALRCRVAQAWRRPRVVSPVRSCDVRRAAARGRRRVRRQTAARARKATADPDPPPKRRKGPAAATRGPLKKPNNSNNSSGFRNTRIAAAAQALRDEGLR
jgi:hypothetical protein